MKKAHTTKILVKGADYFIAALDNNGLRLGLNDGAGSIDLPPHHRDFKELQDLANAAPEVFDTNADEMFDHLFF